MYKLNNLWLKGSQSEMPPNTKKIKNNTRDDKHLTATYHNAVMEKTYKETAVTMKSKLSGGTAPWSAAV
jgi:hypothetical protein